MFNTELINHFQILYMLGFNYNINYFLCTGADPHSSPSVSPSLGRTFTYDIFVLLPAVSGVLHVFVFARIFVFRRNSSSSITSRGGSARRKEGNSEANHSVAGASTSSPVYAPTTARVEANAEPSVSTVMAAAARGDAGERNRNVADLCAR